MLKTNNLPGIAGPIGPDGFVPVSLFPETQKLSNARMICKFFEHIQRKGYSVLAVNESGALADLTDELWAFVGIDRTTLAEEMKQLDALAAAHQEARSEVC